MIAPKEDQVDAPPQRSGIIYQKLSRGILADIEALAKTRSNAAQGFKFRGIDELLNMLHPIFQKHGVYASPEIVSFKTDYFPKSDGKGQWTSIFLHLRLHFKAEDGSSDYSEAIGHGMDLGDKAAAKAMSMAIKYALLDTFLIPTEEDKDADGHAPDPAPKRQTAPAKATFRTSADKKQVDTMARAGAQLDEPPFEPDDVPQDEPPFESEGYGGDWRDHKIHFGKLDGKTLGSLDPRTLAWWQNDWQPKPYKGQIDPENLELRAALDASMQ